MDSIDLIRQNLERSRDRTLAKIEDMAEHGMVFPSDHGGCHTLWILGHLAFFEHEIVDRFMRGAANPLADWEDPFDQEPSADASRYPPFTEVLARLREARAGTLTQLDTLTEADLDRESALCPQGFEHMFGTYRHCLQFVADHWYMHRGQLADARRASRVDRSWF